MSEHSQSREHFLLAMGEEFGATVSPPVPFLEAEPGECCKAIYLALGRNVTPTTLAELSPADYIRISEAFSRWFDCDPPPTMQIAEALARTLARCPAGSVQDAT